MPVQHQIKISDGLGTNRQWLQMDCSYHIIGLTAKIKQFIFLLLVNSDMSNIKVASKCV